MSNKVFGQTRKGGKDWFASDAYSDKEIESIKDPEGGLETSLPTAIPSPFARIDLVKTAFNNIAKTADLRANIVAGNVVASNFDEKLVSESLDLAEMLFNFDSLKDDLSIIVWDRQAEMQKIRHATDEHRRFLETLELYLAQDSGPYNFDLLHRLYIIEYRHTIIGGTSPATLFFPSGYDLSGARVKFTKNHITFGDTYTPLYERDIEFQKYFYLLFYANPLLMQRMKGVAAYLEKCLKKISFVNPELYHELSVMKGKTDADSKKQFYDSYSELDTGKPGETVEVLDVPMRKKKKEDVTGAIEQSDFIILSSKFGGRLPLALQNNLNKTFTYVRDKWDKAVKVPYMDSETILERRWLPGLRVQYPYLTVSDFLEPCIIRLVYPINQESFFDGNLVIEAGSDAKSYLLPLKRKFFEYFDANDLLHSMPGKPKIEMVQGTAGSVMVTLKIPVKKDGEYVSFQRIYYQSSENQLTKPDEENNKGVVVEHQFGVTVFPFSKIDIPEIQPFYRVQLIDRDVAGLMKNTEYDLLFFANTQAEPVEREKKIRSSKSPNTIDVSTQYYVLEKDFDYIQLKNLTSTADSGIIIPKWHVLQNGNEVFSFAIDFGTTNTHVEYKTLSNGTPRPFDITPDDVQIATLFHPKKTEETNFAGTGAIAIRELIDYEFLPRFLGPGRDYKFPQRTVIAESHSLNIETTTFPLADFNIPFVYEKKPEKDRVMSNLKWAKKGAGNSKRVSAFFEIIMMLLRNKVLLNKGNLQQTRLFWFYPSSMKTGRKSSLEQTWAELFQQYFSPLNNPVGITESLAPFFYFKGANKIQGGAYKPVVSVDIGGGTSDIVVYGSEKQGDGGASRPNKPLLLTSFKFAANSVFGDGFSEFGAANSNGLISKYFPYYENLLSLNKIYDLSKVLAAIRDKNKAEDINAFLFSIENSPAVKDKKLFSYNAKLFHDEDLKIIFLYFYSAIIYHIAQLMKINAIALPKHIIFSGTGSKILTIITSDNKLLAGLSRAIFEGVYGEAFDADGITVETEKEIPKQVTCKGGLMCNAEDLAIDVEKIKKTLTCVEAKGIDKLTYDKLTDAVKTDITQYVKDFNAFFVQLNAKFSFANNFNVSVPAMEIFWSELNKHVRDYLEEGIDYNKRLDEVSVQDTEIGESLFFYPIIGAISSIAGPLAQLSPINS